MERPTVEQFKAYFYRDFPYATLQTDLTKVIDADITKALNQAYFAINESLFETEEDYQMAYLYLAAHYLCVDLMAAKQGISGQYNWFVASKSVGNVSESYQFPEYILKNPKLSMISRTPYGAKYISLIVDQLIGGVYVVEGATLA